MLGQNPIGVTLDYIVRQSIEEVPSINPIYPEDGTVVIPSPIAIVQYDLIPARTDITPPKGTPSTDKIPQIQIDWEKLSWREE